MTDNLLRLALLMALCPAPSVLVLFLIYRRRELSQAISRTSFHQMRRRPAGESLRAKLEETDEQICEWLVYLAVCPALLGLAAGLIRLPGLALPLTLFSASVIWTVVCGWRLRLLSQERATCRLAFDGKRFVGEELNRLTAEGFEVYHDVPCDGVTIDHVLIGPPGVFAVQTKTEARPANALPTEECRIEFDGFRVTWPMTLTSYGLEQVVSHARILGQWLTTATGETIHPTPILTLPGWVVDCKTPNPSVLVLSPKEIGRLCDSRIVQLEEPLIRRICHHLDQKRG